MPASVVGNAVAESIGLSKYSFIGTLSLAAFQSGAGLAAYLWVDSKLTRVFVDLERELADLPSEYARNAGIDRRRERLARPVVAFLLLLPIIVALPISLWAALR